MAVNPIIHITATSLKEELNTTGNSPIKVIGSDYNMYVAKNSKNKNPATDIINEVLAHYFLTLWEVPSPNIALITIDPKHLLTEYSDNHRPHYYNNEIFASQWINNAVESLMMFEINKKKDYDQFNNPEILFKIGLFDIWVENDDRRPSNQNLLFQTIDDKKSIIPIDHSFIFGTMNYSNLDPKTFSPIENENIFVSSLGYTLKRYKRKNKKWQPINRDYFYLCLQLCKQEYTNIVANIPHSWGFTEEHQTKLYDFLFNDRRNELVYNDFEYKLR
ncbi:MAG: hypothetical protein IM572_06730 [Chitinophagaceae bacterium]|nr:hypothetical protein [Chitinophagaceae bacterium]MCA6513573.1 hypothetical protein [Chitinophagaceae bacterium]